MNTIPRQTHGNTALAKKNRHDVALSYRIGKRLSIHILKKTMVSTINKVTKFNTTVHYIHNMVSTKTKELSLIQPSITFIRPTKTWFHLNVIIRIINHKLFDNCNHRINLIQPSIAFIRPTKTFFHLNVTIRIINLIYLIIVIIR